jgi:hypothetical protein
MEWTMQANRHLMRYVGYIDRDPILRDFFAKLIAFTAEK